MITIPLLAMGGSRHPDLLAHSARLMPVARRGRNRLIPSPGIRLKFTRRVAERSRRGSFCNNFPQVEATKSRCSADCGKEAGDGIMRDSTAPPRPTSALNHLPDPHR
jgi:hypothetical protein